MTTAALKTRERPPWYAHAMYALIRSRELRRTVRLQTVIENPAEFKARVAKDGFENAEDWVAKKGTEEMAEALTRHFEEWLAKKETGQMAESSTRRFPVEEDEEEEETGFSDDVSEESITDDSWESGESTDETWDPDKVPESESSDDEEEEEEDEEMFESSSSE